MGDVFLACNCLGYNSLRNSSRGNWTTAEGKDVTVKNTISRWGSRIFGKLRQLGPYVAVELILPGGSLIALALWIYNRKQARAAS